MTAPDIARVPVRVLGALIAIGLIEGAVVWRVLADIPIDRTGGVLATLAVATIAKAGLIAAGAARPRPEPRTAAASVRPCGKDSVIHRYRRHWGLTEAESDVAVFAVKGLSNGEIAALRNCTLTTVKSQLGSVYQKSGLRGRYQLIAFVTDEVCADTTESAPATSQLVRPGPGRRRKGSGTLDRLWRMAPFGMPRTRAAALRGIRR